jgi:RecA/RadA recombinase
MKIIDMSKLKKNLTKNVEGLTFGFSQPSTWLGSGCYALNWLLTKDFNRAFPLNGRLSMVAGTSASGKSFICSGNVVKDALSKGIQVILIDTEDRLDEEWMTNIGVNPDHELLTRIQTNSIENVMQIVSMVAKQYKDDNKDIPEDEQAGLLFVVDSLGALFCNDEIERYNDGELSMTDGMRRAGAITRLMNSIITNIATTKMGCIVTNHVYASTDMYSDDKIPGGMKAIFLSTQILQMDKLKLKAKDLEDDSTAEYNKDSDVVGIRSKCKVYKSSWNKASTTVEIQIPYTTGMNPYSGLFDLFSEGIKVNGLPLLQKEGNQYCYCSPLTGKQVWKKFRKNITNEDWDLIMKEYTEYQQKATKE